ncbi:MAG TPA: VTT domain-containing protein [Gemmataceae bacterium]|nr:VTT domain-containing protein [Gemmataceae bacterium]
MFGADVFWKYAAVFGALVAAGFGAPIPEEIPIATGGVLVGRDWDNPDGLKWWIMLPVCIVGVVLCDTILYLGGRKWGRWLIRLKWVQRRILSPEQFEKIEKNFHDYGIRILLIARLLPGIRTPVFLSAGIVRLPFRKFLLADVIYAIPGVNLIFWLAYWLTDSFINLLNRLAPIRELVLVSILSFIAGFIAATFVRRPVATGSPEDLPVLGKPVVSIANPTVPEPKPGQPTIDGRPHGPSTKSPVPAMDGRPHGPSANGPPAGDKSPVVGKPEAEGGVSM